MKRLRVLGPAVLVLFLGGVAPLRADPFVVNLSTPGATFNTPAPGADTVILSPFSGSFGVDFGVPLSISLPGNFVVGDSGTTNQLFPFTLNDPVTINGVTHTIPISGSVLITPTQDTLTFLPSAPTVFDVPGAEVIFSTGALSLPATTLGDHPFSLPAQVLAVPEPSSILLSAFVPLAGLICWARGRKRVQ
jgi:hypothetical protein